MGKVTLARDAMQRLLTDAPDSPHSEDARSFLAMTALEEGGKDLAAAEPEILKILSANPGHAPALMARAALQLQRGDSKAAEGAYTEILGRLPDFAPAQKGLASLYLADPAKREKAYGIAVKARTTLPDDPELARTLAELSFHRKDFANAIQLFQESGKKRPLDAKALYYLGMSHAQAKDKPQALDALRRAVTAGLPDPLAADAKRALAELEKD
jgi:tetratricopeptide (TPR) repeat protein